MLKGETIWEKTKLEEIKITQYDTNRSRKFFELMLILYIKSPSVLITLKLLRKSML